MPSSARFFRFPPHQRNRFLNPFFSFSAKKFCAPILFFLFLRKKRTAASSEEGCCITLPPGRRKLHIRRLLLPFQTVTAPLGYGLVPGDALGTRDEWKSGVYNRGNDRCGGDGSMRASTPTRCGANQRCGGDGRTESSAPTGVRCKPEVRGTGGQGRPPLRVQCKIEGCTVSVKWCLTAIIKIACGA